MTLEKVSSFQERLKIILEEKNLKCNEFAKKFGYSKQSISAYLNGTRSPKRPVIIAIAQLLNINQLWLCGYNVPKDNFNYHSNEYYDEIELDKHRLVPILGSVVAGIPIESQENIEGYIYINQRPVSDYFALRVHGESMIDANITDGCIIVVRKQETADSGDIVVAMLNGEQTVKRFKRFDSTVLLVPENKSFEIIPINPADDFHILGKVVESRNVF